VSCKGKKGKVIAHNIFRQTITVLTQDRERIEVYASGVTVLKPGERKKR